MLPRRARYEPWWGPGWFLGGVLPQVEGPRTGETTQGSRWRPPHGLLRVCLSFFPSSFILPFSPSLFHMHSLRMLVSLEHHLCQEAFLNPLSSGKGPCSVWPEHPLLLCNCLSWFEPLSGNRDRQTEVWMCSQRVITVPNLRATMAVSMGLWRLY